MKKIVNGVITELTAEELAALEKEQAKAAAIENSRPLTETEVLNMLIPMQINTLSVDDNTALRMISYYPSWASGVSYTIGYKLQYNGKLYKVIQAHTSQENWKPDTTYSLFAEICETHTGELNDAIPYNGNMALEKGKYYIQDYELYLCIRDTVNPVYHNLNELVGLYVEVV